MIGSDPRASITDGNADCVVYFTVNFPFHTVQRSGFCFPPVPEAFNHANHYVTATGSEIKRVLNQVRDDVLQLERLRNNTWICVCRAKFVINCPLARYWSPVLKQLPHILVHVGDALAFV